MTNQWSEARLFQIMRKRLEGHPDDGDPEYSSFLKLWGDLVPASDFQTPSKEKGSGEPNAATLKKSRKNSPKFVSEDLFQNFEKLKEKKEREKAREIKGVKIEKERKRKEKKERRRRKEREEQKERERARKMAEKGAKTKLKEKNGRKRKGTELSDSDSENDEELSNMDERSSDSLSFSSSLHRFEKEKCCFCGGKEAELVWVICKCGRWFHQSCACAGDGNSVILDMSEQELAKFDFVCDYCAS